MMVSLPGFSGEVALTRDPPFATLAYQGPRGVFSVGRQYNVDDVVYEVLSTTMSQYVDTVVMVKLREI